MPPTEVMIDGAQFLSKTATGIGAYARTLANTLMDSGCDVAVLYGRPARPKPDAPALSLAAQVFGSDPPRPRWKRLLDNAGTASAAVAGIGRRARAVPVSTEGVDLSAFHPVLPACHRVLNADRIYERAHMRFAVKRRFVQVELPRACRAAHWTGPLAIRARGVPNIYTLHDLVPLQFPHFVVDSGARAVALHAAIAREADHIVTVSEASKRSIIKLLNVREECISVTYQPVPDLPQLAKQDAERLVESIYGVEPYAYALHVGAIEPKKNLRRLVEAFSLAHVSVPLVTAGPLGWLYEDDLALIDSIAGHARIGRRASLRRLGFLPRRHIVALLQCARFFVFPSLYEGFGLPVLEAMKLGIPVLTSNAGSLPEVAGDAAILVSPLNVTAIAEQIRRLANDSDLRADLSRRGPLQAASFDHGSYRRRLADAYRKIGLEIDGGDATLAPRVPNSAGLRQVAYQPAA